MSAAVGWRGGASSAMTRFQAVSAEVSKLNCCGGFAMRRHGVAKFRRRLNSSISRSVTSEARNFVSQWSSTSRRCFSGRAHCDGDASRVVPPNDDVGDGSQRDRRSHDDVRDGIGVLPSRGLLRVAVLIGSATFISKMLGLVREVVLAAGFGVGPVIDAFSYSMIIPGFFLTLLGGINGPLHSATTVALSKRSGVEGRELVQKLTLIICVICGGISIAIFLFAGPLVDGIAPGLKSPSSTNAILTRQFTVVQLKILAPSAILACLTGIGYGVLSSVGIYGLPSLSPALSSVSIMVAVSIYALQKQTNGLSAPDSFAGAVYLAAGAAIGALCQWGLQATAQHKAGFKPLTWEKSERMGSPYFDQGVQETFALLLPATLASGMLQVATYADLYFASFIPGAAGALGYANLLAMAPLGILSSSILVPLLPMFSRLSKPSQQRELQARVSQGLLLTMVPTCLVTALLVALARPIVRIVFERHAFNQSASASVSSLLVLYALSASFYMARDFLVNVFYALGDGAFPFRVSCGTTLAKVYLDWVLVRCAGLGAQGLVVATCIVSCGSAASLMFKLSRKLDVDMRFDVRLYITGSRLRDWTRSFLLLGSSAAVAGVLTRYTYDQLSSRFIPSTALTTTRYLRAVDVSLVACSSAVGLLAYIVPLVTFFSSEIKELRQLLQVEL